LSLIGPRLTQSNVAISYGKCSFPCSANLGTRDVDELIQIGVEY